MWLHLTYGDVEHIIGGFRPYCLDRPYSGRLDRHMWKESDESSRSDEHRCSGHDCCLNFDRWHVDKSSLKLLTSLDSEQDGTTRQPDPRRMQ